MSEQKIIWTVLPRGVDTTTGAKGQRFKFSVLVSPRLKPEPDAARLETFPDFLNWPKKLSGMSFKVEFKTAPPIDATPELSQLDPDLWKVLFKNDTYVRPFTFSDFKDRAIRTYPVRSVLSYIQERYKTIAGKSPGSLPRLEREIDDNGKPIGDADATLESFIDDLGGLLDPGKKILCRINGKYYERFKYHLHLPPEETVKGQLDGLKSAIFTCLHNQKRPISRSMQISRSASNDYTWDIVDTDNNRYFLEDTGEILIVYTFGDIYSDLDSILKDSNVLKPGQTVGGSKVASDFLQANRFYDRRENQQPYYFKPNAYMMPPSDPPPPIDFHQMLSILSDHPLLMRKLGLAVDFTMIIPDDSLKSIQSIRLHPIWNPNDPPSPFHLNLSQPWTECIVQPKQFVARPQPYSQLENGMLKLSGAGDIDKGVNRIYSLTQVDPDGAVLKNLNAASSMARQIKKKFLRHIPSHTASVKKMYTTRDLSVEAARTILEPIEKDADGSKLRFSENAKITQLSACKWMIKDRRLVFLLEKTGSGGLNIYRKMDVSYDTPEDAGLPTHQSVGIALIESGRAYELNRHFNSAFNKNNDYETDNEVTFFADDLVRGYRVDIMDEDENPPIWRSLCRRVGAYKFPGSGRDPIPVKDEGYVKGASTTSGKEEDSDLYFHEVMFRWNGWSLCARKPGRVSESVTHKKEIPLFKWSDIPDNPSELEKFIVFLVEHINAHWVKKDKIFIENSGDTIIVKGSEDYSRYWIRLTLGEDDQVNLTAHNNIQLKYRMINGVVHVAEMVQEEIIKPPTNPALTEFKMESSFEVEPGTLPRLRFGHSYRLRVRTVDLAGNSIESHRANPANATLGLLYRRHEPVIPPVIVPLEKYKEGASAERMVIRSNYDLSVMQYIEANTIYGEKDERHVVPPKTSQARAETLGKFDDYIGKEKDDKTIQSGYDIAIKEKGSLKEAGILEPPSVEGDDGEQPKGQYLIIPEQSFELPYLPDPIARGVAFRDLPGTASDGTPQLEKNIIPSLNLCVLKVPFESDPGWPDAKPFLICIKERPGVIAGNNCEETFENIQDPPDWNPVDRILTVFLAKAQEAVVRFSCYPHKEDLELMEVYNWFEDQPNTRQLRRFARAGSHWMISPYRELVLVHAVQQPLCEPVTPILAALKKQIGDTFASIEGEFLLSVKSTANIDVFANWTEPEDDLEKDEPSSFAVNSHAFQMKIEKRYKDTLPLPIDPCTVHRHEFGDTKYRRVNYYLEATTRFREYFLPSISNVVSYTLDLSNIKSGLLEFLNRQRKTKFTEEGAAITESDDGRTITISENETIVTFTINKDQNTAHVVVEDKEYIYVLQRDKEFEENSRIHIDATYITRRGPVHEVDVFNSARPDAPKALYILPTFKWDESMNLSNLKEPWETFQRKRIGGGLRIYLDRPWYSSGDGELLGVVLYPYPRIPKDLETYVTQWGMDPVRLSQIPKGVLKKSDFANAETIPAELRQEGFSLEEKTGSAVNVAGFKPEFNKERKLWYCDILFDPDEVTSYFPFVRLALTRYQPRSIDNAHLSRVVLTDFIQLANHRTLDIQFEDDRLFYISVSGYASADIKAHRMVVTIETLPPGAHEEFGWEAIDSKKEQPNPYTLRHRYSEEDTYHSIWNARLKLPASRQKKRFRLVVKEFEIYKADADRVRPRAFPYIQSPPAQDDYAKDAERMVYIDIVEVSQ